MRRRVNTNRIIFHHSLSSPATTIDDIRDWHLARNFEDIGYHYVIPYDSHYQSGRDVRYIGAHASGKNFDSIGVCLIGDFRRYEPSVSQITECLNLYHCLCRSYNKNLDIQFHRAISNPCPGVKLDRDDFIEIVSRGRI